MQEEPRNMGAWGYMMTRLWELLGRRGPELRYVGRSSRASPAEGSPEAHAVEQARILTAAWSEKEARAASEATMSVEIRVPPLGESLVEATVGRWLKREGDPVSAGETVVELETEKVNLEVAAEEKGTLDRILRREGETVAVGDVLGAIGAADASRAQSPEPRAQARSEAAEVAASPALPVAPAPSSEGTSRAPATPSRPPAAPSARRLAEEHGIDLAAVTGSGPSGRITGEDVREHVLRGERVPDASTATRPGATNGGAMAGPAGLRHPHGSGATGRARRLPLARPMGGARNGCGCPAAARRSPGGSLRLSRRRRSSPPSMKSTCPP